MESNVSYIRKRTRSQRSEKRETEVVSEEKRIVLQKEARQLQHYFKTRQIRNPTLFSILIRKFCTKTLRERDASKIRGIEVIIRNQ